MTLVSNAFTTYDAKGNKEDYLDLITNIDPVTNWCTSRFQNVTARNTLHQWQTDSLAAPSAAGAATIEGDTVTAAAVTATTVLGNYTQIVRRAFAITDTQEAVAHYGRSSEISYQTQKELKNLANGIEYVITINSATAVGEASAARSAKGVRGWISTNTATNSASASFTGTTGTSTINGLLQKIFDAGSNPKYCITSSQNKMLISGLTANNTRWTAANEKEITYSVDLYRSDFGDVAIFPHRIMSSYAAGDVYIFSDLNLWGLAYLRKPKTEKLARTGTADVYVMEAEFTVESRQEKGSARLRFTA